MTNDTLVVEISGKRPGDKTKRPTEKFDIDYQHLIISNNSEGYETEWDIIDVPDSYREWYIKNCKQSDNAWYAPMNRSYAIKYAREHGYKYLVQLDDNIVALEIRFCDRQTKKMYAASSKNMINDFIHALIVILENSDAAESGLRLMSVRPEGKIIAERYCYSFFALNLEKCPDIFQGDFEDDIEYRLKQKQMGLASLQIIPFAYGKTSQGNNKDASGNRKAYIDAGLKRGDHMRKLYGDIYSCGLAETRISTQAKSEDGVLYFKHKLKPFKVGCTINSEPIYREIKDIMQKYSTLVNTSERHYLRKRKIKYKNGKRTISGMDN